ncbi:MAG TPA: shikimate kinase [Ilumatobacteraceae bacterium]|nr:shikimate kinase [Ilumatobacteraceae bacterium]
MIVGIAADQHVVLVGLMGSGKTTVARIVADRLNRKVIDSDAVIEAATGRTVREIFAEDGEAAFRTLETSALLDALASPVPAVIAAAGGVVLREENREALKRSNAKVVWLCASPALLAERVTSGGHRPLLDDDPAGTLQRMHDDRETMYREVADAIVLVDHRSIGEVVEAVLR